MKPRATIAGDRSLATAPPPCYSNDWRDDAQSVYPWGMTWEYLTLELDLGVLSQRALKPSLERLNAAGDAGWEAVGLTARLWRGNVTVL